MNGKVEEKSIVDQLINNLEKGIPKKTNELQEKSLEDHKILKDLKTKLIILKKYRVRAPITDSEKKELSKILCFENIGYCCKKECHWRNAVMELCGISKEVFEETKEELGLALMSPPGIIYISTKENISEETVEVNRKI